MSKELEQLVLCALRGSDRPRSSGWLFEGVLIQREAGNVWLSNARGALKAELQRMRKAGLIRYTGNGWVIA